MTKPNPSSEESLQAKLENACAGLIFVSETDSDVTPVFGNVPLSKSAADVLMAIGVSPTKQVRSVRFENFFSRLTTKKVWFGEEQLMNAERFIALKRLLQKELSDLKVFRVGKIRLTIFVVGFDREGKIAGVKMDAVET